MNDLLRRHSLWKDKHFAWTVGVSMLLLAASFLVNFVAGQFAARSVSNPVTDVILDNIPVMRVDFVFTEGAILLWTFVVLVLVSEPWRIPFALKAMALFVMIRSAFIVLTHLGPFPDRSAIDPVEIIGTFTFGGDLFFSGHTGAPFLFALMFWRHAMLRSVFLAASVVFGVSVLLGHLHYSIDVFAAFFITYGTFDLAKCFFRRDHELFERAGDWKGHFPAGGKRFRTLRGTSGIQPS